MITTECNHGLTQTPSAGALSAGLELSTSKARLLIADEQGTTCYSAFLIHDRQCGRLGIVQSPAQWLNELGSLFLRAAEDGVPLEQVQVIGVCTTTPTLIFLDATGKPVLDEALLWCDPCVAGKANPT